MLNFIANNIANIVIIIGLIIISGFIIRYLHKNKGACASCSNKGSCTACQMAKTLKQIKKEI